MTDTESANSFPGNGPGIEGFQSLDIDPAYANPVTWAEVYADELDVPARSWAGEGQTAPSVTWDEVLRRSRAAADQDKPEQATLPSPSDGTFSLTPEIYLGDDLSDG